MSCDVVVNSVFHNAYVFADTYSAVAADVFEVLHQTARPANLNPRKEESYNPR
jgi:hypothetical protein